MPVADTQSKSARILWRTNVRPSSAGASSSGRLSVRLCKILLLLFSTFVSRGSGYLNVDTFFRSPLTKEPVFIEGGVLVGPCLQRQ